MGGLFADKLGRTVAPPPPPGAGAGFFDDEPEPAPAPVAPKKASGLRFDAELDLCELDDRDRPGPTWSGRGRELSRAHLGFRSRRMCYTGRRVLAAVHLIDDEPVPLLGRVTSCEYDGDGMYKTEVELIQMLERPEIHAWLAQRRR